MAVEKGTKLKLVVGDGCEAGVAEVVHAASRQRETVKRLVSK